MRIQFIGCGKMGTLLLESIISSKIADINNIGILVKSEKTSLKLVNNYGIYNKEIDNPDILILAIKPNQFNDLNLVNTYKNTLVISIMAGISIKNISNKTLSDRIIRAMPNTPFCVGKGITGYYYINKLKSDIKIFHRIFNKNSILIKCKKEEEIDKITSLSGSGPAYYYLFTEIINKKAELMGFGTKKSKIISENILIGAAKLLEISNLSSETLRKNITSPGGTTEKAIETFENNGLKSIIDEAINLAYKRAQDLNI